MADLQNIGNVLGGLGAGLMGQGPQFQRNQSYNRQIDEQERKQKALEQMERQKTVFTDSFAALTFLEGGRVDLAQQLLGSRLESAQQFEGVDFKQTEQLSTLAGMAATGDEGAIEHLRKTLTNNVKIGQGIGVLEKPSGPQMVDNKNIKDNHITFLNPDGSTTSQQVLDTAQLNNNGETSAENKLQFGSQETFKDEAGNLFFGTAKKNPQTGEMTTVLASIGGGSNDKPVGKLQMVGSLGQTGSEQIEQKRKEAGATKEGGLTGVRRQTAIDEGIGAAQGAAIINRSLELLDSVETGGFNESQLKAKQWLGVESANEAELSANLGKAVLSQLKTVFGAQFTEKEGDRLARIEAGFGKSVLGNRRLLMQTKQIIGQAAKRGIKAAASAGDYRAAADIQELLDFKLEALDSKEDKRSDAGGSSTPIQVNY